MKRHVLRISVIALITFGCVIWTIHLFDWRQIGIAVARMRWGMFILGGLMLIACGFFIRGVRWLIVLGLPFDRQSFWQSFRANGAASGLASLTPFQLGEILKIHMMRTSGTDTWKERVPALFVERVMDLAGVAGVGLCGLCTQFDLTWPALIALLLPVWSGQLLYLLGSLTRYLPNRTQSYIGLLRHYHRMTAASLLTIMLWLLYAALWWSAISAIHVTVGFGQVSILLGGVMLTMIASMTPAGLGVAELGSQGILIWLGKSQAEAEAAAIALRLLTPLLVISGGLCLLPQLLHRLSKKPGSNSR